MMMNGEMTANEVTRVVHLAVHCTVYLMKGTWVTEFKEG